jgi:hypothetical protein
VMLDDFRVCVVPGDGIVARLGDAIVVVPFDGPVDHAAVDRLLDECAKGSLGPRLADIRAAAATGVASYGVVAEVDGGLAVHVDGDADAAISGAAPVLRLSGRAPGWSNVFREPFASLAVGRDTDAPGGAPHHIDLKAGVVSGSGVLLVPTTAGAQPRPAAAPTEADGPVAVAVAVERDEPPAAPAAPAPSPPATENEATAGAPVAPGGPQPAEVWGVRCKKGHFNDPEARYCAVCGIHMVQDKAVRVRGPRPVLGYLVFDDGKTYKLDTDYVIGRDPQGHDAVRSGAARPLVFGAGEDVISDVHARIVLRDWGVLVADCHSLYGTYVWAPGTAAWERLTGDEPVALTAGSQVMLAQRSFMFQPVNKR